MSHDCMLDKLRASSILCMTVECPVVCQWQRSSAEQHAMPQASGHTRHGRCSHAWLSMRQPEVMLFLHNTKEQMEHQAPDEPLSLGL